MPEMVVNARDMKNVPGRKNDVQDVEWIADLLKHGLLKASFIPDKTQRELCELVTYRKSLVKTKGSELNRLQEMLESANINMSARSVISMGKVHGHFYPACLKMISMV